LTPIKNHQSSTYQQPNFPMLAIAVLCIMAAAFLLVSYYIFLTKCCFNWQQLDPLPRFSLSRPQRHEDPLTAYSPSLQSHGLDELLIREIPTFQYKSGEERSIYECVVCLNEFQEQDMLRVLPNCGHGFHLDCIDIWLQTNANCPLCRSSISGTTRYPIERVVAPTSSPQDPLPFVDTHLGGNEDFVVIELSGADRTEINDLRQQRSRHSPRKFEKKIGKAKPRKFQHVSIMGDECIDVRREEEDEFSVQPIRRSFSMDSASDPNVYLAVQEIIRQNQCCNEVRQSEESSSRVRRQFFPFGHGRGSRSAVLPIEFQQ
ncbi:RING-H2 finger protein ATL16-like, partial [Camellia sinensis]